MIEDRKCLFSKEELEKVSNIVENNISILLKSEDYCNQEEKIANLHETICLKLINTELETLFWEYNKEMLDHKIYELALVYNIGKIMGMELSDLKNEIKVYEECLSKRIIDFSKYLDEKQINCLKELKIIIENRLYTVEEFDKIDKDLLSYYNMSNTPHEQIDEILEIFAKISNDYEIK